jgi:hypothetical protein
MYWYYKYVSIFIAPYSGNIKIDIQRRFFVLKHPLSDRQRGKRALKHPISFTCRVGVALKYGKNTRRQWERGVRYPVVG